MAQSLKIEGPLLEQGVIGDGILRDLPAWFGIESSIVEYRTAIDRMPTFLARRGDTVVGFMTVECHFPGAAELHVLGVLEREHRTGVGRALLEHVEAWLREDDCRWLQVKTLSEQRTCKAYAKSRAWYDAMGFEPLQVFPLLWDECNPCLQLVKRIDLSAC
jgi:GNAT superfamily N-acetyltransferase